MPLNIDIDQNSARLKISKDIYLRILRKAIEQTIPDLTELRRGLDEKDYAVIQRISHRVKGDFANLRIDEMSSVAREMNDMMKDPVQVDAGKLNFLYDGLTSVFGQLQQMIPKPDQQKGV